MSVEFRRELIALLEKYDAEIFWEDRLLVETKVGTRLLSVPGLTVNASDIRCAYPEDEGTKKVGNRFRDLNIGDTFDFVSGSRFDSFFKRCEKISINKYRDEDGTEHRIGSQKAFVYHVERKREA